MEASSPLRARSLLVGSLAGAITYGLLKDHAGPVVAAGLLTVGGPVLKEVVKFGAEWVNGLFAEVGGGAADESLRTWRRQRQSLPPETLDGMIGGALAEALRAFADTDPLLAPAERKKLPALADGVALRWTRIGSGTSLSETEVVELLTHSPATRPDAIWSDWPAIASWLCREEQSGSGGATSLYLAVPAAAVRRLAFYLEREVPARLDDAWRARARVRDGAWAELVVLLLSETLQRLSAPAASADAAGLRAAAVSALESFLPQLHETFVQANAPLLAWLKQIDRRLAFDLQATRQAAEAGRDLIQQTHEMLADFVAGKYVPAADMEQERFSRLAAEERLQQVEASLRIVAGQFRSRSPAVAKALLALLAQETDRAQELLAQALGEPGADRALLLRMRGDAEMLAGQPARAQEWYLRSLRERPDSADLLEGIARALAVQQHYTGAEKMYKQALAIRLKTQGRTHYRTAMLLMDLGGLYKTMGRYDEAAFALENVRQVSREALGEDTIAELWSLDLIGRIYMSQGDYQQAETILRLSADKAVAKWGSNHPDTAASFNNLAELLRTTGRFDEAEPFYRRSLQIQEKVFGEEHPNTAIGLSNLALLLNATGRFDEAEPLLRRSLQIQEKVFGEGHSHTGQSLNNLAGLLYATGRSKEAEPLFQRALSILTEILGVEHPSTKTCRENLAECLAKAADNSSEGKSISPATPAPDPLASLPESGAGLFGGAGRFFKRRGP